MNKRYVLIVIAVMLVVGVLFLGMRPAKDEYSLYPHEPFYVSISADGNYILARRHSGAVHLFSRENNVPVWSHYHDAWIDYVSMSADGNYIVTDDRFSGVYLFRRTDNTPIWRLGPEDSKLQISPDGTRVLIVGDSDFSLFRWSDNAILSSYSFPLPVYASVLADNFIAVVRYDSVGDNALAPRSLYLFNIGDNAPVLLFRASGSLARLAVSGDYIVAGGGSDIYFLSRENGLLWSTSIPDDVSVGTVAISMDGSYVVADEGGSYYVRDTRYREGGPAGLHLFSRDGTLVWSYRTSTRWDGGASTSISADGSHIAIGDMRWLYLFSRADNTPLWTYEFPEHISVESVSISADSSYIAVGTEGGPRPNIGGSVYLFDKDGNLLWSYYHEVEPYAHI